MRCYEIGVISLPIKIKKTTIMTDRIILIDLFRFEVWDDQVKSKGMTKGSGAKHMARANGSLNNSSFMLILQIHKSNLSLAR